MKDKIYIFDTTLRDGEQSPGASMNIEEKIRIAQQLERLGVDVIEAGFAIASPGDFEAINQIASIVSNSTICSLSRCVEADIKASGEAIARAKRKRVHMVIATSPIHMEFKLKSTPDEVIKKAVRSVQYGRTFADEVEFSCEDATRSEIGFLKEILDAVIAAGATTVNIPDTVGYILPHVFGPFIKELSDFVGNRATVSVHCHNDLGLAVANSLAAILNGAKQAECTINGLGERAGNAALEEIVMAIKTRGDLFDGKFTEINTKEIYPSSKLVSAITGIACQPNKAIVGKNAFSHASGIHQDGVLKYRQTYEIMDAASIGRDVGSDTIVLAKHSGRAAVADRARQLGFELSGADLQVAYEKMIALADKKKEIFDEDLRMILTDAASHVPKVYELFALQIADAFGGIAHAAATMKTPDGEVTDAAVGDGTIDAVFKVIDRISGVYGSLMDYKVEAVSEGKDALASVTVKVVFEENRPAMLGHGLDIDTMTASAKAYVNSLNSYLSMKDGLKKLGSEETGV